MSHRILIIDDSPTVLASLSAALKSDGYDVQTLSQFMELAKMLESFRPAVIILDLLMPGFSGVQFAGFVQQFCEQPPPILLYSGSDRELVRIAAREIRPFEIISKGTSMRDLRRSVGRAVAYSLGWNTGVEQAKQKPGERPRPTATGTSGEFARPDAAGARRRAASDS